MSANKIKRVSDYLVALAAKRSTYSWMLYRWPHLIVGKKANPQPPKRGPGKADCVQAHFQGIKQRP